MNTKTLQLLTHGRDAWNSWRKQNPEARIDLQGAELQPSALGHEDFAGIDLRSADLRGAKIYRLRLDDADFTDADLREAHFVGGRLNRAVFLRADLRRAEIKDSANFEHATFEDADLGGLIFRWRYDSQAWIRLANANLRGANLDGVELDRVDLRGADLTKAKLSGANLSGAMLDGANLSDVDLRGADLRGTSLQQTCFKRTDCTRLDFRQARIGCCDFTSSTLRDAIFAATALDGTRFERADLERANLSRTSLRDVDLSHANLKGADLRGANLGSAKLEATNLTDARLDSADLIGVSGRGANLTGASLVHARLIDSDLSNATLSGCRVYGTSTWNLQLERAEQKSLVITRGEEPVITVDNLKVAQFIYLLISNAEVRQVVDTITSKVVLILGRFTPERKAVLDAIREALRVRDYLPILFDFERPRALDYSETVGLLARLARFVIADLSEPGSIPQELQVIAPTVAVPIQPLLSDDRTYSMFQDLRKYPWVLTPHRYQRVDDLLASLHEKVIAPAESKAHELIAAKRSPG